MRVSKKELVLAGLAALFAAVFFYLFAGGPQGSDEIGYMNNALNNIKSDLIPNRYFHVYLLKLFMALAPNPISGSAAMWCFLIALCGLLIYLCARTLSAQNTPLHGLIAVGLFLTYQFISENAGSTTVDFTAMTMVMLVLALFIFSSYREHRSRWLLAALGLAFFLAFKTKETTVFIGILFLGLGYAQDDDYDFRLLWRRLLQLLPGVAAGILLFILLNAIFLKNPLFGLLPSALLAVYTIYERSITYHPDPASWYSNYILVSTQVAFVLYLISLGRLTQPRFRRDLRLVWIYPILLVVFLTLTMIRSEWGILERYFYPGQMVVCVLAVQFLDLRFPSGRREWLTSAAILLACLVIWFAGRTWAMQMTQQTNWVYDNFIETILNPILLSLLIGLVVLARRFDYRTLPVFLVILFVLTYHPILDNVRNLVVLRKPQIMNVARFTPFSTFKETIQFEPGMRMYVGSQVAEPLRIHVNRDELMCMFNVYFHAATIRDNFSFSPESGPIPVGVIGEDFDYILLSQAEWEQIEDDLSPNEITGQGYELVPDPGNNYVLIKKGW